MDNRTSELWAWTREINKLLCGYDHKEQQALLLASCDSISSSLQEIDVSFPSSEAKKQSNKWLDFPGKGYKRDKFSFKNLILAARNALTSPQKSDIISINTIIMLLSDVVLYWIYQDLCNDAYGGVYYQLNMCVILDAMRSKPKNSSFIALLKDATDKIRLNLPNESYLTIWTVAMLNYRTHRYEVAIEFFNRYIDTAMQEADYQDKKTRAKIHIGYCQEKLGALSADDTCKITKFQEAIDKFEELLDENNTSPLKSEYVTELHHGLGHFYNDLAVFGNTSNRDKKQKTKGKESACDKAGNLLKARMHMRIAVQSNPVFYSCYGSLYHEFGDLERALAIFDEASRQFDSANKDKVSEVSYEVLFYRAHTKSTLSEKRGDVFEKQADNEYTDFEQYCARTFNFDGISHAKLFKIRNKLREIALTTQNLDNRKATINKLISWKRELLNNPLSDYASEEIKTEYTKTICILDSLATLYSGDTFDWKSQDLFIYLNRFLSLMSDDSIEDDYTEHAAGNTALKQVQIGRMHFWCIGGEDLVDVLKKEVNVLNDKLLNNSNIPPTFRFNQTTVKSIENVDAAHKIILGSGKPDIVLVIPPQGNDADPYFEQELSLLDDTIQENETSVESCFLFANPMEGHYSTSKHISIKSLHYSDDTQSIVQFAICIRALEVLKKEILQPMPLFSLAPTHFSSTYNFQFGEESTFQPDLLKRRCSSEEKGREIQGFLGTVDSKYKSTWTQRKTVKASKQALLEMCCRYGGFFAACFPKPEERSISQNDYISYLVFDNRKFNETLFYGNNTRDVYTIKALPNYYQHYHKLAGLIVKPQKVCKKSQPDEATCMYQTNVSLCEENELSKHSQALLESVFGEFVKNINYPYRCILKKVKNDKSYIYMVLSEHMLDEPPSWEEGQSINEDGTRKNDNHDRKHRKKESSLKTIYLSYSDADAHIADEIKSALQKRRLSVKCISDVEKGGNLRKYQENIRKADFVVFVVSDSYLRDQKCLFEMMQFLKDDNYRKRAIPISIQFTVEEINNRKEKGLATEQFGEIHMTEIVKLWQDKAESMKNQIEPLAIENRPELDTIYREKKDYAKAVSSFIYNVLKDKNLPPIDPNSPNYDAIAETIKSKVLAAST